jgi:hypothetical protein
MKETGTNLTLMDYSNTPRKNGRDMVHQVVTEHLGLKGNADFTEEQNFACAL